MEYKLKICMIFILIFCSCTKKIKQQEKKYTHKMILNQEKLIHLDSTTIQATPYLQFFTKEDTNYLAFTNEYDNSIIINNFDSGLLHKKIRFDKEGKNGIGNLCSFYLSDTTIYTYNYGNKTLYATDLNGSILKRKKIDLNVYNKDSNIPVLFPQTLSPIYKLNNNLILTGYISIEKEDENGENTPTTVIYNIDNDSIYLINSFPAIYHNGFWGGDLNYRSIRYTIGKNKEMVISYSIDSHIYTIDSLKCRNKYYAGSINHKKKTNPIENNRNINTYSFDKNKLINHYMKNKIYGGILFDKYKNVYYRIFLNTNQNSSKEKFKFKKPISIIILNTNFVKIGETSIPDFNYDISSCFVSPKGLHIRIESENDDLMKFKTFILQEI